MSSAFKNLPKSVARELARHVSKKPLKDPKLVLQELQAAREANNRRIFKGVLVFTGLAASIPVVSWIWLGGLVHQDDPLTQSQVRRGAFLNTGSRDVGRDPDWDVQTGEYTKKDEIGYSDDVNDLSGEFLAMNKEEYAKHKQQIEGFAKGRIRKTQ